MLKNYIKNKRYKKRTCPIKMRLVPYGSGWTDVYADFGDGELYFVISDIMCDSFGSLMKALYCLYPENNDPGDMLCMNPHMMDSKLGAYEVIDGKRVLYKVADDINELGTDYYTEIPWKAWFCWDGEGTDSEWVLEREPNMDTSFLVKVHITQHDEIEKHYEYVVNYEDLCYAVADACTEALKEHGIYGYHYSSQYHDMNLRYLLFLKSVALRNMDARELTSHRNENKGESTDFNKEIELLLFDMK
ncbi:MAG: hypothetical protein IKG47_12415 [Oscillospiraceae bacterium]|nr:hypothetical protein [Oscillospiraceae bacterium]